MILAILDDLMFTSKIKTAASHLGVPVTFARIVRTRRLPEMRKSAPTLVIFDLNNQRTDPLRHARRDEARAGARGHSNHGLRLARAG